MSNFVFLESHWKDLSRLGELSEKYVYSDPNTSIIKQGMLSEIMVNNADVPASLGIQMTFDALMEEAENKIS